MIYVDSDACPVKPEVMRVAKRHGLKVIFVSNSWMRLPGEWDAELVVVEGRFDAADDWIAERVKPGDVVVTADIPLAHRSLVNGARVIEPNGRILSGENIGNVLGMRDLLHVLRGAGEITGGPPPFQKADRSRFLQNLEEILQEIKRSEAG